MGTVSDDVTAFDCRLRAVRVLNAVRLYLSADRKAG